MGVQERRQRGSRASTRRYPKTVDEALKQMIFWMLTTGGARIAESAMKKLTKAEAGALIELGMFLGADDGLAYKLLLELDK